MNRTCAFDPVTHRYTIDGKVVPSVTQVVRRFAPFPFACDPWYLTRGTMVHKACALLVLGELDESTIDPRIAGYVAAAKRYLSPEVFGEITTMIVETPTYDKRGQFAGTPDLWANHVLIDWKSSDDPATEIQLGGYVELLMGHRHPTTTRVCRAIELHDDGTFTVTEYDPKRCLGLWRAALTMWQWCEANGYNRKPKDERD